MQREEKFLIKIRSYQVGVSGVHKQATLFISRFAGFVGIFVIDHLPPDFQSQLKIKHLNKKLGGGHDESQSCS